MHHGASSRQAHVPAFRVSTVRQHNDLIDRTALACMRSNADALIDTRTITTHSPAVMQDELRIGDLTHLGNIVVLKHVFPFPESCCNSNLISYADLHRRGNEHVPLTLSSWFELPGLPLRSSVTVSQFVSLTVHFSPGRNPPTVRLRGEIMSDVLPARSASRCCSTALWCNSTSSMTSLMIPKCSSFSQPAWSRPAFRSSIADFSAGTFCLCV